MWSSDNRNSRSCFLEADRDSLYTVIVSSHLLMEIKRTTKNDTLEERISLPFYSHHSAQSLQLPDLKNSNVSRFHIDLCFWVLAVVFLLFLMRFSPPLLVVHRLFLNFITYLLAFLFHLTIRLSLCPPIRLHFSVCLFRLQKRIAISRSV